MEETYLELTNGKRMPSSSNISIIWLFVRPLCSSKISKIYSFIRGRRTFPCLASAIKNPLFRSNFKVPSNDFIKSCSDNKFVQGIYQHEGIHFFVGVFKTMYGGMPLLAFLLVSIVIFSLNVKF